VGAAVEKELHGKKGALANELQKLQSDCEERAGLKRGACVAKNEG